MNFDKPVKHWKIETKRLFVRMLEEWEFDFSGRILLKTACEEYDKWLKASEKVEELGPVIVSPTGHVRRNPACNLARDARNGFLQAWRMFNLDMEIPGPIGRPQKGY
jgi:phage terminase small subunit